MRNFNINNTISISLRNDWRNIDIIDRDDNIMSATL